MFTFSDLKWPLQVNFKCNFLICILKMPFYAVAVGVTPGVYRTWAECQNQTKGYPHAKFRKFDTQGEANNFVKSMGSLISNNSPSKPNIVETLNPPELIKVGSYSSQTLLKQDKVGLIAEKLDRFIDETNRRLNEFGQKLESLESFVYHGSSGEGKRKIDDDSELAEEKGKKSTKKKRTSKNIEKTAELSDEEDTRPNVSSRSKTKSVNGSVEEVDGPLNSYNTTSQEGFIMGSDGFVIVYTDGACSNNGRNNARAGLGVWFNHNNPFNVAARVDGTPTNNNAEIQAATRAIEQARLAGITKLNIHTDSQFMINCITDWMKKWKRNNWMTSNGGNVKNKEQLQILDDAISTLEAVKWTHVRGHVGNEGNECADSLARAGASMP